MKANKRVVKSWHNQNTTLIHLYSNWTIIGVGKLLNEIYSKILLILYYRKDNFDVI